MITARPRVRIGPTVLCVVAFLCWLTGFTASGIAQTVDETVVSANLVEAAASTPITLNLAQTDVRTVFMAIGALAGLNVMVDPDVQGTVSVSLQDLPVDIAIETVARQAGVKATISDGVLTVTLASEQVIKEAKAATGIVRVYALQYADVEKVKEIAATVVPEVRISGDNSSRRIVAVGTAADLDLLEGFLELFDRAGQQVLIEARVQEISRNAVQRLGINWKMPSFTAGTDIVTGMGTWTMADLAATLDALETKGEARLLARPQITTVSGEVAPIFVGDQIPIVLKGAEGEGESIANIEAGIRLEIEPRISPSGTITAHVELEVSSIAEWTPQGMPVVRTRRAETTVQVEDGQPIIIGGLIKQEENQSMARVPILGSLPIIGALFRWNRSDNNQMETVIILTPYLIENDAPTQLLDTNSLLAEEPSLEPQAFASALEPKFSVAYILTATGSGVQVGLGFSRSANSWWEAQAGTLLPPAPVHSYWGGLAWRKETPAAYSALRLNYLSQPSVTHHWEYGAAAGLHFHFSMAGLNLALEPELQLRVPLDGSAASPSLDAALVLAYRF